jgi:hypothetical protein
MSRGPVVALDPRVESDYYFAVVSHLGRALSTTERRSMRRAIELGVSAFDFAVACRASDAATFVADAGARA